MSYLNSRVLAPRIFFVSAIFCLLFLTFTSVHAQSEEDCGVIIGRDDYPEIEDCNNPFNAITGTPFQVTLNGIEIEEGTRMALTIGDFYTFTTNKTNTDFYDVRLFYKFENDYYEVFQLPNFASLPPEISLAIEEHYFFTIRGLSVNLMEKERNNEDLTEEEWKIIEEFKEYAQYSMSFMPGEYTLVFEEYEPAVVSSLSKFDRILNFFVPTAHAQSEDELKTYAVSFTVSDASLVEENPTSVFFLPGIKSSRLYTDGVLGTEDRVWEPFPNSDVEQLAMSENGESVNEIYTRDVIDEAFSVKDIYSGFLNYLDEAVSSNLVSAKYIFAYDWRYDMFDIVENGTQYEDEVLNPVEELEALANESESKVTIIAHSNGGLLAKALLQKLEEEGKIDLVERVIFLASPQLGTPKSIGSILHGYGEVIAWGLIVNDETARTVIRNMPGAYGLLPSLAYFDAVSDTIISFDDSDMAEQFVDAYGSTIDSLSELTEFMNGTEGRDDAETIEDPAKANAMMLAEASAYHSDLLDDWVAPEGVEIIEIVGTGLDTVNGFRYEEFTGEECWFGRFGCRQVSYLKPIPLFTQEGDGTVIAASAEAYDGEKTTYYLDLGEDDTDAGHANIGESEYTQALLTAILAGETVDVPYVRTELDMSNEERDMVSVHSPVSIAVTDSNGNEVRVEDDRVISEIPNSTYMEFAGGKYIIVPSDIDYAIDMRGEDEGSYTVRIDSLEGENSTTTFSHIGTVNEDTQMSFTKTAGEYTPLIIDEDGDGEAEERIQIEEEVPELEQYTYDDLQDAIEALDIRHGQKISLRVQARLAERFSEANSWWSFSRTESRFLESMERKLKRLDRRGKLTAEEYEYISDIIEKLKE